MTVKMWRSYLTMKGCVTVIICLIMKLSVEQMVNQIKMRTSEIQKISLTLLTLSKMQTSNSTCSTSRNNQEHPKVEDFVKYKILRSNDFQKAQIIKRAGKIWGKYSNWCIIKIVNDDTISSIAWKSVDKWKTNEKYSQEEDLINSSFNDFWDFDITNAKLEELINWRHIKFMVQLITNEKFIDLRWVFSEKYINGEPNVKVRWLPRGSKKITLLF